MTTPDFNLGDFIESLPYENGPGSEDEYIANQLIIKRLQLRNEELKDSMLQKGKKYLPSSDAHYYIGISQRSNYSYSKKIEKLEAELSALRAQINAKKKIEEQFGEAKLKEPTMVLAVRAMTNEVLERINRNADSLDPHLNEDDDL